LDWLEHHPLTRVARRTLPETAREGKSFSMDISGLRAEAVSQPEEGIWSLRVTHIDISIKGGPRMPGRLWIQEVGLRTIDGETQLGVRTECTGTDPAGDEAPRERPPFLRDLVRDPGLVDVRPLVPLPWILRDEADQDAFRDFLSNPARTLPVVLLTEVDFGQTPIGTDRFLLPAEELAQRLLGLAHVVAMPKQLTYRWSDTLGKVWSAHSGAVRTYWPQIDFERDDPRDHPLILANRVLFYTYEDLRAEAAYMAWLTDNILRVNSREQIDWGDIVFSAETKSPEPAAEPTEERDWRAVYDEQISSLKARVDQLELQGTRDTLGLHQLAADRETLLTESLRLQALLDGFREALYAKTGIDPDADIALPTTHEELVLWAESNLVGRLDLHPRAARALANSRFEDPGTIAQALQLLACEFRDMKQNIVGAREDFEEGLRDLHLECLATVSRERANDEGDAYLVEYVGAPGGRQFLDLQLRLGDGRDERDSLTLYFAWSEERQRVLVGNMPMYAAGRPA